MMKQFSWSLPFLVLSMVGCAHERVGWQANPQLVAQESKKRPDVIYDEAKVPRYTLPDPLLSADGSRVKTRQQWTARREELLELFRSQMFGRSPGKPQELRFDVLSEDKQALQGAATLRRVAIHSKQGERTHRFDITVLTPNAAKHPAPAFLLIDNRGLATTAIARAESSEFWPVEAIIARGYATAAFHTSDVAPDDAKRFRDGIIRTLEGDPATRHADAWGAISAWAWAGSRVLDYLETDPRIDAKRVGILGHSRGGKTALWAGAQDSRFAIAMSNESGCGGAALARRRFGETLKHINTRFPYWFNDNYKAYNGREDDLPLDQHELIALMAPRAVYVACADEDLWCDPRGNYEALAAASPAYSLFNERKMPAGPVPPLGEQLIVGSRGWHIREGKHNLTPFDWQKYLDFADHVLPKR